MDENFDYNLIFDPQYQNNQFLIEDAMRSVGIMDGPESTLPDIFDEQLRALIDAVPLG